ncbi:transglutaminase family protein [Microbacteriaceae bacterium VKM Ac-2854]|nr:transglutaminase family protein [Microbacteriaceae bacterium VKM Ac-2854]
MLRTVSASLDLRLNGTTDLVFAMTVAKGAYEVAESFVVEVDGTPVELREFEARHGTRLHRAESGAGTMTVRYRAEVSGRAAPDVPSELELIEYLRPSRFCEADALTPLARSEFGGLSGEPALAAVEAWVHERMSYVFGSTVSTGGAMQAIESRRGVCRDYAHAVVALLRALDIPARVAAVFAPGLVPMDFHAVAEAWHDGAWHVLDATRLAPRTTMLRIAAGRDTADTAFLSNYLTDLSLLSIAVTADSDRPAENTHAGLVQLG